MHCICRSILGVLGPWEFLWRAGSYTFSVCDSAMWSAGPVQVSLGILLERVAALYRFSFSSGAYSSGYGTVEMMKGGGPFSCFLQFAVSFLGGWMSTVGIFVLYILLFFGRFVVLSRCL